MQDNPPGGQGFFEAIFCEIVLCSLDWPSGKPCGVSQKILELLVDRPYSILNRLPELVNRLAEDPEGCALAFRLLIKARLRDREVFLPIPGLPNVQKIRRSTRSHNRRKHRIRCRHRDRPRKVLGSRFQTARRNWLSHGDQFGLL